MRELDTSLLPSVVLGRLERGVSPPNGHDVEGQVLRDQLEFAMYSLETYPHVCSSLFQTHFF